MEVRRTVGLVLGWQITASTIFYGMFAATQFLPQAFDISPLFVGFAVTALMLGYTLCLFPVGSLVDGYGERPVLIGALMGLAGGAFAVTLARRYSVLLLAMFVLGCVYASAMPATNRAIVTNVPETHRGLAMGVKQVGVTAGSGLGAFLVTWFATTRFSWRAGFTVAAMLALVSVLVFVTAYRGDAGTGRVRLAAITDFDAGPAYRGLVLAGAFLGAGLFTTTGYTTLYVNEQPGTSATFAGTVFIVMQIGGSVARVATGQISDMMDAAPARANALVLVAQAVVATLLLLTITVVSSRLAILVTFFLLGGTLLGFTGVYYACLGSLVSSDDIGAATAGGQTALNAGALLAPPVFGVLVDAIGFHAGWGALAVSTLVATGTLVIYLPAADEPRD